MDRRTIIVATGALGIATVAGFVGGGTNGGDVALVRALVAQRLAHPWLDAVTQVVTRFGSATFLIPLVIAVAGWLLWRRRTPNALFVVATALSGRVAVELVKAAVARPRPEVAPYPVHVSSFSFPSGHAANSMTTYLAIAVALAPPRYRARTLAVALVASLLVGATRPLLGVHWPTDVLAGWAFGIFWVAACWMLVRRRAETAA